MTANAVTRFMAGPAAAMATRPSQGWVRNFSGPPSGIEPSSASWSPAI